MRWCRRATPVGAKTILFTDQTAWSTAQIVTTYRDAWHVEAPFRDLKQAPWVHGQPQFHGTDQKLRVHGFICILAVTLAHLFNRERAAAGIDLEALYRRLGLAAFDPTTAY